MQNARLLLAVTMLGCTSIPQAPPTSAVSEDASPAPLPTIVALRNEAQDAATKAPEEQPHHHHGGDHGGH